MTQSKTHSKGKFSGKNVNLGINITPFGIGGQIGAGIHRGISSGTSDTYGRTDSTTESSQNSWQTSRSTQRGLSSGKSLQLYYENRSVKTVLDQIDQNLLRLDACSSFGAFDCAAYVIADDRETAVAVASNYNALMRGKIPMYRRPISIHGIVPRKPNCSGSIWAHSPIRVSVPIPQAKSLLHQLLS